MHLLTLLIAAVFSSQFSKLNADPVTFSVEPEYVAVTDKVTIAVQQLDQDNAAWTGDVLIALSAEDEAPEEPGSWLETEEAPAGDDLVKYVTKNPFDFKAFEELEAGDPIYVFVKVNNAVLVEDPTTITVKTPWSLKADPIHADFIAITGIEVTPGVPAWDVDDNKVTVYASKTEVTEPSAESEEWIGFAESGAFQNDKYSIAALTIYGHTLKEGDTIYLYVGYEPKAANTQTVDPIPQTLTVVAAISRFTITAPDPAKVPITNDTITFIITQSVDEDPAWSTSSAKLRLTLDPEADVTELENVAITTTQGRTHTVSNYELSNLGRLVDGDKIFVHVVLTDGEHEHILAIHKEIAVDGELETTFEITSPAKIVKATMTTFDLIVKEKVAPQGEATWTADVGFFITPDMRHIAKSDDDWVEADAAGDSYKATITLADLELEDEDKVYVWVRHGIEPKANTDTIIPVPVVLAVSELPDATFEVNQPEAIKEEHLAEPIDFALTPKNPEDWEEKNVVITISTTKTPPKGADIPFTEPLTPPGEEETAWTASINLSEIDVEEIDEQLYVHVKVGDAAYDPYYATITFTPAKKVAFTVSIPDEIKEETKETPVAFEIVTEEGETWAAEVKLTIATTTATPNGTALFTEALTAGTGENATKWTATINLAALVVPPNQNVVYARVKNGTDYISDIAEITYVHADEPEPTVFVIDPAEINWAADLKLAKTQIKPTPSAPEDWPKTGETMKFKISNPAAPTIAAVSGTVLIETVEDSVKWFIPKDTEIKTLVATEPTADVSLKVELSIEDGEWLEESTTLKVKKVGSEDPEAAIGVSPLFTLLAALVFLFVKLF